jgi:hypothetical protein
VSRNPSYTQRQRAKSGYAKKRYEARIAKAIKEQAMTPEERQITAVHEAGHAVTAEIMDFAVDYISIVPEAVSLDHPEARAAHAVGRIAVRQGGCQLVLVNGTVPGTGGIRTMFYLTHGMAGIAAEARLGVSLMENSFSYTSDIRKTQELFNADTSEETQKELMMGGMVFAKMMIENDSVWLAIADVAYLLLTQERVTGDQVRQIVKADVPESAMMPASEQSNLSEPLGFYFAKKMGIELPFTKEEAIAAYKAEMEDQQVPA